MEKNFIPNIMLFIRIALLALLSASLIFLDNIVSGVIFLFSIALQIIELLLKSRFNTNSKFEKYAVPITNKLLIIIPLIFIACAKGISIWILLIAVFFDIVAWFMSVKIQQEKADKFKISNMLYAIYSLLLFFGIFSWFFEKPYFIYFIYFALIIVSAYIIYQSLRINVEPSKSNDITVHKEKDGDKENKLSKSIEVSADKQKEIVE